MVKNRVSATVDEKTIHTINEVLKKGKFRNKSHLIEAAIALLAEKEHE